MTHHTTGAERQIDGTTTVTITFQGLIGLMARAEVRRHLERNTAANAATKPVKKSEEEVGK
ncbi:hypothetical protein KUW09_12995 [Mameliella alba]|nr:hypothetical protein [Antarctobacter heliothermus]MBY6144968.1 hypothetical protein [Mameliella alba]MCA0955954.1 hypothetical protein [Mameliella alba]